MPARYKAGGCFPLTRTPVPRVSTLFLLTLLAACQTGPAGTSEPGTDPSSQGAGAVPAVSSQYKSPETADESGGTPVESPPADTFFSTVTPLPFGSCSDNLSFMGDLTYPDRTRVLPGQPLEKRWKVRNSGLCDWGPEYRFRWVGGTALSTQQEFALFPAVAGSEAVITVLLTAPVSPGNYISNWRAFSPLGIAFGDTLYIDVVVSS